MPPGRSYHPPGVDEALARLLAAGDRDALLATFMREVVGLSEADLAAYRTNPVWPVRVAAAPTIVREMAAELDPVASLEVLGRVRQPVLQILGGASIPVFRDGVAALDDRLADGTVVVIPGAAACRAPHAPQRRRRGHAGVPPARRASRPPTSPRPTHRPCETDDMLDMGIVGWIVVGLIAGAISGALVGGRTARGCLPNVVVGIVGGVIGGWLVTAMGFGQTSGFLAALVVAVFGALGVRLVLQRDGAEVGPDGGAIWPCPCGGLGYHRAHD